MNELFVLAIDHRDSLRRWYRALFGEGPDERTILADLKSVVLEGLAVAIERGMVAGETALLVDEEYGGPLAPAARALGTRLIMPVEQSGQREFLFEHGEQFPRNLEHLPADLVKALVRYNPGGERGQNARSARRLKILQAELHRRGRPWVLELLVPPEPSQLAAVDASVARYDDELRLELTLQAIDELTDSGLRPELWKLEGHRTAGAFARVAEHVKRATPSSRCLVLGRGQDRRAVEHWVDLAAEIPGFCGFAVGRTLWERPLATWQERRISRAEAAAQIAEGYLALVDRFRVGRTFPGASLGTKPTASYRSTSGDFTA